MSWWGFSNIIMPEGLARPMDRMDNAIRWCHTCHVGEFGRRDLRCWNCEGPMTTDAPLGAYQGD